jgi:hypothetical protein
MQTLKLEIQDNMIDKVISLLGNFKDIKIENITNDNLNDIRLFEEAKKDTKEIKNIDEILKEYSIES